MTERVGTINFGVLERDALPEKIATRLLSLIKERHLLSGDKLPAERDLAATLQVSRSSLREALRALGVIGVVDTRQGDGTYITSLEPDLLVDHLEYVVALNDSTFAHLFEARKALELSIVTVAAEKISDEELAHLEQTLRRSKSTLADYPMFLQSDLEFHELIAAATHNPIFESPYMASIRRLGRASRNRNAAIPGLPEQSYSDHQQILSALQKRDSSAAYQAMLTHLNHVEVRLKTAPTPELIPTPTASSSLRTTAQKPYR